MRVSAQRKAITGYKRDVLKLLARLQYSTVLQVSYWSKGRHVSRSYAALEWLELSGHVKRHSALKPHIFSLTREGYRASGSKPPSGSRLESWSVLTHRCHRNTAEIRLREHYDDFTFLSRGEMYSKGVNPAFGEHLGFTGDRLFLMLLDDYYMDSTRISHVLKRVHRPNKYYFDVKKHQVPNWSDVATDFVVAATDEEQYLAHKKYIQKYTLDVKLLKIEGLW